jgi:hypothetical protein
MRCFHYYNSPAHRPIGPVSPFLKLKFSGSSRAQYGAMLVKTSDSYTEKNKRDLVFRRYMKQHWRSWLAFARSNAIGQIVKKEDLMLIVGLELTKDFSATAFYSRDSDFRFAFEAGVSNLASLSAGGWKRRSTAPPPAPDAGTSYASGSEMQSSGASESDNDSTDSPGSEADMSRVHVEYNAGPSTSAPSLPSLGGPIIQDDPWLGPSAPPDHRQSVFIRRICYRPRLNRLMRLVAPLELRAGAGPHDLGSGDRSAPDAPRIPSQEDSDSDSSDSELELVSDPRAQVCHTHLITLAAVTYHSAMSFKTRSTLPSNMSFECVASTVHSHSMPDVSYRIPLPRRSSSEMTMSLS